MADQIVDASADPAIPPSRRKAASRAPLNFSRDNLLRRLQIALHQGCAETFIRFGPPRLHSRDDPLLRPHKLGAPFQRERLKEK